MPLLWAFGQGVAGQTYVFEHDGALYESRVSFYNALGGLDLTMGAQHRPQEYRRRGRPPHGCFRRAGLLRLPLHRRGLRRPPAPGNHRARRGCESCHGPAEQHVAAVRAGDPRGGEDAETGRPHRRRDGGTLRSLPSHLVADCAEWPPRCAQRPLPTVPPGQQQMLRHRRRAHRLLRLPRSAWSARDQRWRATTAQCSACHSTALHTKTCRVANANCVTCHMPKIELPGAHASFTDHQIRIARAGEPYPN